MGRWTCCLVHLPWGRHRRPWPGILPFRLRVGRFGGEPRSPFGAPREVVHRALEPVGKWVRRRDQSRRSTACRSPSTPSYATGAASCHKQVQRTGRESAPDANEHARTGRSHRTVGSGGSLRRDGCPSVRRATSGGSGRSASSPAPSESGARSPSSPRVWSCSSRPRCRRP